MDDHMNESNNGLRIIPEVADQLRKSPDQLRWMIHTGNAPRSAIIGGRRMFRQSDVDAFIDAAFAEVGN
jgi:predicted DNA-binding transcriptional regulator AlpA